MAAEARASLHGAAEFCRALCATTKLGKGKKPLSCIQFGLTHHDRIVGMIFIQASTRNAVNWDGLAVVTQILVKRPRDAVGGTFIELLSGNSFKKSSRKREKAIDNLQTTQRKKNSVNPVDNAVPTQERLLQCTRIGAKIGETIDSFRVNRSRGPLKRPPMKTRHQRNRVKKKKKKLGKRTRSEASVMGRPAEGVGGPAEGAAGGGGGVLPSFFFLLPTGNRWVARGVGRPASRRARPAIRWLSPMRMLAALASVSGGAASQ